MLIAGNLLEKPRLPQPHRVRRRLYIQGRPPAQRVPSSTRLPRAREAVAIKKFIIAL